MPPVAVNTVDEPAQIAEAPLIAAVGNAFSVTVLEAVLEHPLASVPITEYVPAVATNVLLVELSDHTYEEAPFAVNVVLPPIQ